MAGLFDTFTVAVRGLAVQQSSINTTSHNIANANTEGYSRQRSVAETTKPFGGMSKFASEKAGQVGTGAEITAIQRIRDSFIDYQVRSETGTSAYYSTTKTTLSKVEDTFGEPSDTGIQELISKFYSAFQEVSKNPDKSDVKTVAVKKASALADQINYTYNQLQKTCEDTQDVLKANAIDVNSYLDQINELNKQIGSVSSLGQTPNDLMDKRDLLLDQLSNKFGIRIDKESFETINLSSTEYPNEALVKSDPNDKDYTRLSYVKSATAVKDASGLLTGDVTVEYYPLGKESAATQSFTVSAGAAVVNTDSPADKKTKTKAVQDVIDNLTQNRILLADKDGIVTTTTTSTVTQNIGTASGQIPAITIPPAATPNATTVTDTITPADGSTSTSTITTTPNVTTIPSTTKIQIIKSELVGGVLTQVSVSTTTITTKALSTTAELNAKIFNTHEYEKDNSGTAINNVDNNNIKGDIASNQSVQEKIHEYMDQLDRLAAGLAYSVNAIQNGSIDDGTPTSQGLNNNLIFVTYDEKNKENLHTDTGITAKTIRINSALLKDSTKLNGNTTSTSGPGDGKRAAAIANLNIVKMNLSNVSADEDLSTMDRKAFLTAIGIDTTTTGFSDTTCLALNAGIEGSTIESYYKSTINNVGVDNQEATRISNNQDTKLSRLEDDKSAVSGVSLDEEMTNLIQFQHAYQANAKIISTINELLDVVINGLMK